MLEEASRSQDGKCLILKTVSKEILGFFHWVRACLAPSSALGLDLKKDGVETPSFLWREGQWKLGKH